jgi:hypothetical protein
VEEAGEAEEVKAAKALPAVLPFTLAARIPVVPDPTKVIVFVLEVAEVMRPVEFATTTVFPAVFGDAGIEPPPVLSGAAPEALRGELPTEVTARVVIVLRLGGGVGISKLKSSFI